MSAGPPACRFYSTAQGLNSDDANATLCVVRHLGSHLQYLWSWKKHVSTHLLFRGPTSAKLLAPLTCHPVQLFPPQNSVFKSPHPFDYSLLFLSFKLTNFRFPTLAIFDLMAIFNHGRDHFFTPITALRVSLPSLLILDTVTQHYSPKSTLNPFVPIFLPCLCLENPNLARPQCTYLKTVCEHIPRLQKVTQPCWRLSH